MKRSARQALGQGALAAALLAIVLPAAAEIVELRFDAAGSYSHKGTVAPGKFVEICGALPQGAKVAWRFEAPAPLDFNIHYHEGKKVAFPAQLKQVAQANDTLVVKLPQDYCWMWSNKSAAPVPLTATLQRGG